MRFSFFKHSMTRGMGLLGLLGLGFVQAGCAHQVMVEPSVVFHSRLGSAPVTVQVGVPGVVYMPQPHVVYGAPAPRVVYTTPVYNVPVYRYPQAIAYVERRDVWVGRHPSEHRGRHWEDRDHGRGDNHGHGFGRDHGDRRYGR